MDLRRACWFLLAVTTGCSEGTNEEGDDFASARGSVACHSWQKEFCDLIRRCGGAPEACEQAKGVYCSSDPAATACAGRLKDAACGSASAECTPLALADPAPARADCERFLTAVCDHTVGCNAGTSRESCVAGTGLDCTRAVASKPALETCIQGVQLLECSAAALPPTCNGAVISN